MQQAFIDLLHRETQAGEGRAQSGEDVDYDRYIDQLQGVVQEIASTKNPDAMRSLLESPYNGNSYLGLWISSRKDALPIVMDVAKHGNTIERLNAITVLWEMVVRGDGRQPPHRFPEEIFPLITLTPVERRAAKKLIVESLSDDKVRDSAIEGLGEIGDKGDLEILGKLQRDHPQVSFGPIYAHALNKLQSQQKH